MKFIWRELFGHWMKNGGMKPMQRMKKMAETIARKYGGKL